MKDGNVLGVAYVIIIALHGNFLFSHECVNSVIT